MKGLNRLVLTAWLAFFCLWACKGGPSFSGPPPEGASAVPAPPPDTVLPAEGPGEADDPPLSPPGEAGGAGESGYALIEPSDNFAESEAPDTPPPEPAVGAVLPEPPEPPPVSEAPAVPAPETAPESPPLVPSAPVTPPVTPPRPAAAPPVPPAPPHIRPAEPEPPSPAARERPPVPVNPLPDLPARTSPAAGDGEIAFSRVVRATEGQLIEIPFRGTGWVYLGELGSRRGVDYDSRRLDAEGQSFIFRAAEAGTYALKFYKEDFIRDYILNDYVQVIVGEPPDTAGAGWFNPPVNRDRVIAEPRWPEVPPREPAAGRLPAAPGTGTAPPGIVPAMPGGAAPAVSGAPPGMPSVVPPVVPQAGMSPTGTVQPETAAGPSGVPPAGPGPAGPGAFPGASPEGAGSGVPENASPEEYVRRAREEYDAGRIAPALAILDQFRERFPSGSDEAWWLYGQLLEANGPSRDIRSALDYYRRLTREYPQSSRYDDARRRISYLERYYINIQ